MKLTPQKAVFWILILIAGIIFLFQLRTSKEDIKRGNEKKLVISMVDVRQSPPNDLKSYKVDIVLDTPTRFIFNQYLQVELPIIPDRDTICTYSYDRSTGLGTWTQQFPSSNGTFQMFPDGDGFRVVQSKSSGAFLTESLLVYSYE